MFPSCFVYYHVRPSSFNMTACTLEICIEHKDFLTIFFCLRMYYVHSEMIKLGQSITTACTCLRGWALMNHVVCDIIACTPYFCIVMLGGYFAGRHKVRDDWHIQTNYFCFFTLASAKTSLLSSQNQNNELKKAKKELKSAGLGSILWGFIALSDSSLHIDC